VTGRPDMAVEDTAGPARVSAGSRVRLRPLRQRPGGDGWVIGRIETGDFITVPEVANRVITLLGEDCTVDEVAGRLRAETGTTFAVADFVAALDELGFVAAVDDRARPDKAHPRPSLPWLAPRHVRWLAHPLIPAVVAGFAVAAVAMLVLHPALLPSSRVLVFSRHAGLVIAVNAAIAWTLILIHELAHLAVARAVGAPARITLGTRLQFLAAQTDVSGVWAAPRRTRMTVYLAGMGIDVCVAGSCLLIAGLAGLHGLAGHLLAVAAAETVLGLVGQFMVFMRTDIYFVLQDLTGCANLYADGSAYLRYLGGRAARSIRRAGAAGSDPSQDYPGPRRRAVRLYSVLLLTGTVICLGIEFAVSLPALITLIGHAVAELATTPAAAADGATALAILVGFQVVWASRWQHRHWHQVRSIARHYLPPGKEVRRHGRDLRDVR
jgi:putative peptide zinc metalloprotease protein